jgi:DNA-binding FadR family transcriptional regulator
MMSMDNLPVKRQNLADEVANRLQQQISLGQYEIGQKLPTEPELMVQFGVGRSTIREAVRILANTGLLRVQQGLGTFVEAVEVNSETLSQRLQRAQFHDLNEIRQLLEVKIAEKAALHRTDSDIEKMQALLEKRKEMALANRPDECIQADIDFHTSIAAASKNEILVDLYKTIACHLKQSFIARFSSTETFAQTQDLHKALLQSIIDQEPEQALDWATRIITRPD